QRSGTDFIYFRLILCGRLFLTSGARAAARRAAEKVVWQYYVLMTTLDPFAGNRCICVYVIFRIKSESTLFERFPRRLLRRSVFRRSFYSRLAFSAGTAVRLTFVHKAAFTYSPFRSIRTENADRSAIVFIPFQWRISFRSQRREKFRLHFRPSLLCDAFFALA